MCCQLEFSWIYGSNSIFSIRFIEPKTLLSSTTPTLPSSDIHIQSDEPPPGTVKSIIPCTPLAVVKCLEHIGVYNKILPYGDRAYGKTITVINRSVGQPKYEGLEFMFSKGPKSLADPLQLFFPMMELVYFLLILIPSRLDDSVDFAT